MSAASMPGLEGTRSARAGGVACDAMGMWNRLLEAVGLRDPVAVEDPLAAQGRAPKPAKIEPDAKAGGGFAPATDEEASAMVARVNKAAQAAMPEGGPLGADLRFDPAALGGGEQE